MAEDKANITGRPDSGPRTRILIVDDSKVLRKIIRAILAHQDDFEIVGEGCDGVECIRMANALQPDIITLDINMPIKDGIETLQTLRKFTDTPVIIVSALPVEDKGMAEHLMELGATATVMKNFSGPIGLASFEAELLETIRAVRNSIASMHDTDP